MWEFPFSNYCLLLPLPLPHPAHENNAHCLPIAVNAIGGSVFSFYGSNHQREKMKEFLVVSEGLVRMNVMIL